ncbi:hypothetical protein J437_LFUL015465 [Ladona fulva]|uniref:BED-type domain-containing protein n=1 Tax=Ladona fulva TaxID=123851 RepID=A0A8K0KMN4_LADFU|nr:hypothetical protein J437_LFUL015465 [Ladona fulva]
MRSAASAFRLSHLWAVNTKKLSFWLRIFILFITPPGQEPHTHEDLSPRQAIGGGSFAQQYHPSIATMPRQNKSRVWNYFSKKDKKVAVCDLCHREINTHGTTSNLMDHIKHRHPTVHLMESVDKDQESVIQSRSTIQEGFVDNPQLPSTSFQERGTKGDSSKLQGAKKSSQLTILGTMKVQELSHAKIKSLNASLMDMIAKDFIPVSAVVNDGFQKFIKELEPRYNLPSRRTLTCRLLPERYEILRERAQELISEAAYAALTTDLWTSVPLQGYLSATAHFIVRGKLFSVILATRKEICRVLSEISSDWAVWDKIVAVVTDNAANMEVAVRRMGVLHLCCIAHTLNLLVQESLSSPLLSEFEDLRRPCCLIVGHFKLSTSATAKLVKSQEVLNRPLLKLKQEVATRWNSTLIMLRRLLEVKTSLTLALTCLPRSPPALTNRQWEILEDCIPLLNPLEELTTELSSDKYVTSSVIIPLIMGAQHLVMNSKPATTVGEHLKEVLLENFSKRLSPYEKHVITSSTTILDPRFKKMAIGLEENASKAYNRIQDEADALHLREKCRCEYVRRGNTYIYK